MIVCRKCTTRFDDDSIARCTNCDADLTGADGLRLGTALRTDWNPAEATPPPASEPEPEPDLPPRPDPDPAPAPAPAGSPDTDEPPPAAEPPEWPFVSKAPDLSAFAAGQDVIQVPSSDGAPSRARRGRRPGESDDDEVEPVANVTEAPAEPTPFSEIGTHLVAEREHAAQQRLDQLEDVPDEAPARSPEQTTATSVPTITETVTLGQDEVACRECGRANGATRRFCRYCGGTLPAFHDDRVVDDDEPVDEPLIRRLLGTTRKPGRDGRTFGQRARDSGQRKLKYRAKYTLKSRLRSVGLVGGGVVGLLVILGPVRQRVTELVNPPDPTRVDAVLETGTAAVPGGSFDAKNAHDGDPETAFALPWTDAPVSFEVVLPSTPRADELVFETGFPNSDDRGPLFLRPQTLTLSANGTRQEITLEDHEGEQRVTLDLGEPPSTILVTIVEVHQRDWTTYDRVAIAEIKVVG